MNIQHLSFNQLTTHLSCSTNNGFIIYKLSQNVTQSIFRELNAGIGKMNMLNTTNLSIMVGGGETPFRPEDTVIVWDDHKKSCILEIELKESVKNVLITIDSLIVLLENKVRVCSLNDGEYIGLKDTYYNKYGLCKISTKNNKLVIATLGQKKGQIAIWKVNTDDYKMIQAHDNNIGAIALNNDGTLVATISEIGTNINIYDTRTYKLVYKFRRGTTSAHVYDICFDNDSSHIACCSRNGTVHIFNLSQEKDTKNIQSMFSSFKDYLPEYFSSQWSSQKVYLDDTSKAVCSFDINGILHIVTYDGNYYRISNNDGKYENINKSILHTDQK